MKKLLFGSLVVFFMIYQTACESEPKENYGPLYGKWELETATNNGKPTELLTGLFFDFAEDGTMKTNVTGMAEKVNFTLKEGKIEQREGRIDLDYEIKSMNDSSLVLITKIRNASFQFNLSKVASQEDE
jgi:hypothetical protein